jgi:glutaryl-CoA dehydrogenase (non-decarboxylating)
MAEDLISNAEARQSTFASFADEQIAPYADACDINERLAPEVLDAVARAGYFGLTIPREYGGLEGSTIELGGLHEELGRVCSSLRSVLTVHTMVSHAICRWGDHAQKERLLPILATGEAFGALALTEESAGSDIAGIEASAIRKAEGYSLHGTKKWVTAGEIATVFLMFAKCNGAPTAFLVDRRSLAISPQPIRGMLGIRGAMLADICFDGCLLKPEQVLGRPGFGLSHVATTALDIGRYSVACGCTGISEACLRACADYCQHRSQFGSPLADHQLIQRMLTRMIVDTQAARLMCRHAGYLAMMRNPEAYAATAAAKYLASRVATQSSLDAVQIHGATGCAMNHPVSRYLRDARIMEIIEGSTQILEVLIARSASVLQRARPNEETENSRLIARPTI